MRKREGRKQKEVITIVGLGYVGLPLACLCVEKGYKTYGIAKDKRKLDMINNGENPLVDDQSLNKVIATKAIQAGRDFNCVAKSDIIIICVPTPVDEFHNPDLTPVESASKNVAKYLKKGQLVIIESTINPGVCEEVVKPILEEISSLQAGKDFYLAHCPERINPGDPKWSVRNIPRVVGALSKKGLILAIKFYKNIIEGDIKGMKSIKEAEAAKIVENSFRDINIAFVNELAKSFEKLDIDLYDVIQGAATKPFAFMPHWPSVGVGGHCIPVDPYYLIERAKIAGFDHKFLKLAREINNSMPKYAVGLLTAALNNLGKPINGTKIGILGLSYKADVGDIRESPSLKVIKILKDRGAALEVYDPYFSEKSSVKSLSELLRKTQAILVVTNHKEFINMDVKKLKQYGIKVVIDGKNCLNKNEIQKMDIIYKGIGR
jgi:nucleotide sugar dehydrogenase